MKILKIFRRFAEPQQAKKVKRIPPCPIVYDRNNVTASEFKRYVHWLAENNVSRTFQEPDRFLTRAEREAFDKKEAELNEYRKFVRYLAENNINRTFYC